MKNTFTTTIKHVAFGAVASLVIIGAVSAAPSPAHACIKALGFLDPICVITGKADLPLPGFNNNDAPAQQTINNTYNNSNNVNSNVNSPNSTVGGTPVVYNTTPIYNYNYPSYPSNPPLQAPLNVTCYPNVLSARTGDNVSWYASAYGGNGSYNYSWTGTDGLSGYGSSISKRYYNTGYKSATVTVVSGNQTISRNCDDTVNVYGDYYYNNPPTYYPPTYYPLTVSCSANMTSAGTGVTVRWTAYVSGGTGSYSYSWTGTDSLSGSSQSVSRAYYNPGYKYATVTVWSGGYSVTQSCSNSVNVYTYNNYPQYPQYPVYQGNLDIACYAENRNISVGQTAVWKAEATGGVAPYTYIWSGSDGLSGTGSVLSKTYSSAGNKAAVLTVRSADGRQETRDCSTSVTVSSPTPVAKAPVKDKCDSKHCDDRYDRYDNGRNNMSAASLFSLQNVPWGWVAVLVILLLFFTVLYLLYNRPKI